MCVGVCVFCVATETTMQGRPDTAPVFSRYFYLAHVISRILSHCLLCKRPGEQIR